MLLQLPLQWSEGVVDEAGTDWLSVEDVSLRVDGRVLLDRMSLRFCRGEWVALVDPVGDTASGLLALIEGRTAPKRGRLRWFSSGSADLACILGGLQWPAEVSLRQLTTALGLPITADAWLEYGLHRRLDWSLAALTPLESRLVQLQCARASGARTLLLDDPLQGLDEGDRMTLLAALRATRARFPQSLWRVPTLQGQELGVDRRIDLDRGRVCADRRLGRMPSPTDNHRAAGRPAAPVFRMPSPVSRPTTETSGVPERSGWARMGGLRR